MRLNISLLSILFTLVFAHSFNTKLAGQPNETAASPSGSIVVDFFLLGDDTPAYMVRHRGVTVINTSAFGFEFQGQPALGAGMEIMEAVTFSADEEWEMPWGEQRLVRNHYNGLLIKMKEQKAPHRTWHMEFRVYDDGLGFRHLFPGQKQMDTAIIMEEHTEFNLTGDHTCWWIPGDWDIYEHLYNTTPFTEIDAVFKRNHPNLAQTHIPHNAVNTPVTMATADGLHLSFHEANLTDYAGMTLGVDPENLKMKSILVGSDRLGYKVKRAVPFETPWRTIQIAEEAKDLISSNLIINLNEPDRIGDVSWFKPMKYMGIWWEMHLGVSTWAMEGGRHGATTEKAKAYIDFAADHGIGGLLVEGWNTGWEKWIGFEDREGVFDFVTSYPDYDLEEVVRYGREKGVALIMHHETSAAPRTYDQQLDTAYALMKRLGIHSVKTGYVGKIIPKGEYHHGQWMVNHYRRVLEQGAKYQVAINAHEPIKDTGIRRTLPNAISREGLRGQEFNAFSVEGGNPPEHLPIVAFTRMLSGPIDFTPGAFNIGLPQKPDNQVKTTLAQQLALYVVIYSPIQMACDLLENYEGQPAFKFITDVGVDWEQTVVLDGEVGDFVTIARQERGTDDWFLGSITDENQRDIAVDFGFLDNGKEYVATIYRDGPGAHWKDNPTSLSIEQVLVTKESKKAFHLAPGGGLAISLIAED